MQHFPLAGLIMKLPCWGQPPDQNCFDDSLYWEVKIPPLNSSSLEIFQIYWMSTKRTFKSCADFSHKFVMQIAFLLGSWRGGWNWGELSSCRSLKEQSWGLNMHQQPTERLFIGRVTADDQDQLVDISSCSFKHQQTVHFTWHTIFETQRLASPLGKKQLQYIFRDF